MTSQLQNMLRAIPGVDQLLEETKTNAIFQDIPLRILKTAIRSVTDRIRQEILKESRHEFSHETLIDDIHKYAKKIIAPRLLPVINATGVVLHTNLGRALLAKKALENIQCIASGYSNLEFNIEEGKRGIRYTAVESLLCELTGSQAAMAVNNNAGAVLLCLDTMASGKEVIVSRGELVEIGGSFRIPDVMAKSGGILREVGTTNRTHLKDYENAISENTALLMKVHTSNYRIEGFTSSVSLKELVELGRKYDIPVMEDLGSGSLMDLSKFGLANEPTVSDAVASGADIITFSGDKLLGGPQAGIITGVKSVMEEIKSNPLTRALRIDKLTLAALEATLNLYRDESTALEQIPGLRMLTLTYEETVNAADAFKKLLKEKIASAAHIGHADLSSRTGGGAYPELALPSRCITVIPLHISVAHLEKKMRMNKPAIIGRIENEKFIIDPRTLQGDDFSIIADALASILTKE